VTPRLALSFREAARALRIDRTKTLHALIDAGSLVPVPWGRGQRIPFEQVEQLARVGFRLDAKPAVSRARRPASTAGRIRDLEVEP
jgi:hypothetical protein